MKQEYTMDGMAVHCRAECTHSHLVQQVQLDSGKKTGEHGEEHAHRLHTDSNTSAGSNCGPWSRDAVALLTAPLGTKNRKEGKMF